jgi:dTDP-4-amino-4,6-dideoxygalactose transaminase
MKLQGINCVFHYVPLHSSPGGRKYGRVHKKLKVTDDLADRLVRLPIWVGLDASCVVSALYDQLK